MSHSINELHFDSILPDLKVTSQKQIFASLANHVEKIVGTSSDQLVHTLCEAEKNQTSGVGNGVAIPHAKLDRLTKPLIIFTRSINVIDFSAADNLPVDLICLVLSPAHEEKTHLQQLAKTSRFFSNNYFCNAVRHAENNDDIKSVLNDFNKRRIAA